MIGKAAVLIDGGYIRALNRDYFGLKRIDFLKFSEELCKPDCTRFRTYYYICPPYQSDPPSKKGTRTKIKHGQVSTRIKEVP